MTGVQTCALPIYAVKSALASGVRLIDTASAYGNEEEVGQAVRESGVPREEIFVITKLYPGSQYDNPEQAIQDALDKLGIGYIDMMLLHHPGENDVKAYKAIEHCIRRQNPLDRVVQLVYQGAGGISAPGVHYPGAGAK